MPFQPAPSVPLSAPLLRCLSIRQPYASWLANPEWFRQAGIPPKTIENRNWRTTYRGTLLLHASKTFEEDAFGYWSRRVAGLERAVSMNKADYPTGCIIGSSTLASCITYDDVASNDVWFQGEYGFVLADAHPLAAPIPHRGQLQIFSLSCERGSPLAKEPLYKEGGTPDV